MPHPFELILQFRERAPVDVASLISAIGLEYTEAYLHPEISGMIEKRGDSYLITVNVFDPRTRKRFTAAHELGHYILHRDKIGDGIDDDRLYRSTAVGKYHNTAIGRKEETEANRFAANLLMPMELVERYGREFQQKERVADYRSREGARWLAERFGVSEHAMCIRLGVRYEAAA